MVIGNKATNLFFGIVLTTRNIFFFNYIYLYPYTFDKFWILSSKKETKTQVVIPKWRKKLRKDKFILSTNLKWKFNAGDETNRAIRNDKYIFY